MNVMKVAWEIARDGQKKFGGKAKEYLSESLKIAWEWHRRRKSVEARELALKNRYRAYPIDAVLPQLQGSEKQIKWANGIRDTFITNIKHHIDGIVQKNNLSPEQAEKGAEMLNAIVRWAVENRLQASYWINLHLNSDSKLDMLTKIKTDMDKEVAA